MEQSKILKKAEIVLSRAFEASKEKGTYYVFRAGLKRIVRWIENCYLCLGYYYYKLFKSWRTFRFQGKTYRYFYHRCNTTWRNERAIEIPIFWNIMKRYRERNILEIGNVLSHYFPVNHDIVDKYEKADGVINQDVVHFYSPKKYDLVVSISTLEHVGWNEDLSNHKNLNDPRKILQAIENLKGLLAPKGKIIITLPLGYPGARTQANPELDKLLRDGSIQFTRLFYLKRISKDNRWIEVCRKDLYNARYETLSYAVTLVIGIIEK